MSGQPKNKPLAGKRVLVTRAFTQNDSLAEDLSRRGATVVAIPAIEFAPPSDYDPLDRLIENLPTYDWLIFTSANAVEFFFRRLYERRGGSDSLRGARFAAVGSSTSARLEREGFAADVVPEEFVAEGVIEALQSALRNENDTLAGKRILFPRARVAREVISDELTRLGAVVDVVEVYQTIRPPSLGEDVRSALRKGRFDLLIFTSPSTVANVADALGTKDLSVFFPDSVVASIGAITSEAARNLGLRVSIEPPSSTAHHLVAAIEEYFSNQPFPSG